MLNYQTDRVKYPLFILYIAEIYSCDFYSKDSLPEGNIHR